MGHRNIYAAAKSQRKRIGGRPRGGAADVRIKVSGNVGMRSAQQYMGEGPDLSAAKSYLGAKHVGKQVGLNIPGATSRAERSGRNCETLRITVITLKFRNESEVPSEVEINGPPASIQTVSVRDIGVGGVKTCVTVIYGEFYFGDGVLGGRGQTIQRNEDNT